MPKADDLSSIFIADLSTDYRWGGRIFFTDRDFLQNRRPWRQYWVAGRAQEFAYLLVKKIYEKGNFPEHQRVRIRDLVCELGQTSHLVLTRLLGRASGDQLLDWIVREQWEQIASHVPQLRRRLRLQILKRDYLNSLRYCLGEARRFWNRWRFPTGVSIAVLSSKRESTYALVRDLQEAFTKVFRQSAVFELAPSLCSRHTPRLPGSSSPSVPSYRTRLSFPFFRHRLDYGLQYFWRVRPLLVKSTLVFLEGHCDELLLDGYLRHLLPSPCVCPLILRTDLLFILGSEESNSLISELFTSDKEFRHEWSPCMRLPRRPPKAVVLDARLSAKGISQRACEVLSAFLTERYEERRQVWFSTSGPV